MTATTMVQGETDTCYRMAVEAFRQEVERRGRSPHYSSVFSQALFGSVAQIDGVQCRAHRGAAVGPLAVDGE